MNKGESNAVGRLGSKDYRERRNKGVYPVPRTPDENEQSASDSPEQSDEFSFHYTAAIATFGSIVVGCIIVGILADRMFDEDELRLHILDALVKIFQTIARIAGSWALQCENAYNEYVNILH